MLLPTGLLHHGSAVKAQVPTLVMDSLRCGGTLDGQLCEDRAWDGSTSVKSVQALRAGKAPLRWVAEDRRAEDREEPSSLAKKFGLGSYLRCGLRSEQFASTDHLGLEYRGGPDTRLILDRVWRTP